ncbi:MAG: Do family serine endopeptidase [Nitratireductor sp.]
MIRHKSRTARRFAAALLATTMLLSPAAVAGFPVSVLQANAEAVSVNAPEVPGFADVVEAVSPAVVSVRVESEMQPASNRNGRFDRRFSGEDDEYNFRLPPFFRDQPFFRHGPDSDRPGRGQRDERRQGRNGDDNERYGNRDGMPRDGFRERGPRRFGMSQGSGFLVSDDGYIVTNHHVVENGSKFTVVLNDATELEATLVGADARTDLAVLKVKDDRKFTYVKFDEGKVRIGEWVVAVGNPFGLGGTVTAGIVSAANREIGSRRYDDFIQIDAAVNKGNSGGPAFNLKGEVIGINTAIFSPSGGNVGIAFAIPAATASQVVKELIDNGQVVRGWLGVMIQPVTRDIAESVGLDDAHGAIVTNPQSDSPADKAGIRPGDVITAVNGDSVKNPRELARKIGNFAPEEKVTVSLWRNGKAEDVQVTLGKLEGGTQLASARADSGDTERLTTLGLALETNPDGNGVVVAEVAADSPADRKGFKAGDIISSVNGEEVSDPAAVSKVVKEADDLGRKAALFQVRRGEDSLFVALPLKRG